MSSPRAAIASAPLTPEPFVSADEAARFLSLTRRYVLVLARKGIAGAYRLGTGSKRKIWIFRLSELAAAVAGEKADPKTRGVRYDPAQPSVFVNERSI